MIPMQTVLPEWTALAPVLVLVLTGLLLLVIDSIEPQTTSRTWLTGVSLIGTLTALAIAVWYLVAGTGQEATGGPITLFRETIVVDGMALFFTAIFASVAALVVIASYDYLEGHDNVAEFYSLLVFATTGMALMAVANSLVTVFVALEMASLPSYALVAYLKKDRGSVEAGLKYFLIGALSSSIFVFGVSLIYAVTGTLLLDEIAASLAGGYAEVAPLAGVGILMIVGGFAFKTASVPFHFWAPEAYEGAPAPVSAFLSSASKAAGFVVAFRVFAEAFMPVLEMAPTIDWALAFAVLAVATMTLGNLAAATQENVKRMLAYSSIGHAGYALIGLAAITSGSAALNGDVMGAAMAHLLVYGFMNTGAFLFIAMVEYWGVGRTFEDYAGLARRAPIACVAMSVFMFSLAGLPLFGGFFSKYALFMAAIGSGFWWLAAVGAVMSALSLYYYSRVVKAIWIEEPNGSLDAIDSKPTGLYAAVIVAAVATVLLLPGFGPVIETAQTVAYELFV